MEHLRIVGRLGKSTGANANIFEAVRVSDNRHVVLKRIHLVDRDQHARQQARMECALMQRMQHPHVVSCDDVFLFNDEDLCIVMNFFTGGDLGSFIGRANQLHEPNISEDAVMRWFVQLALALHFLHSHRIVHRDVKAGNVFIDSHNNVVLGDFGIAKIAVGDTDEVTSGTPMYMAPELLQGQGSSFKSDVWALGCILYEMLCYRHPFEAKDVSTLVVRVIRGNFPPIPRRYSSEVCELLVRLLDAQPDTRPAIDEILMMPYVQRHVKRFAASVGTHPPGHGRGATAKEQAAHENLVAQLDALNPATAPGVHPSPHNTHANGLQSQHYATPSKHGYVVGNTLSSPVPSEDVSPVHKASPYAHVSSRLHAHHNGNASGRSPAPSSQAPSTHPSPSHHSGSPHGANGQRHSTVSSTYATPTRQLAPGRVAAARQREAQSDVQSQTSSSVSHGRRRGPPQPRDEHELQLYEAARERDNTYLRVKEKHRTDVFGRQLRSVRETVETVLYRPSPEPMDTPGPQRGYDAPSFVSFSDVAAEQARVRPVRQRR